MERERIGFGTGHPRTKLSLALDASCKAIARVQRRKEAARFNPPTAAPFYFPYAHRTVAEVDAAPC